MSRKGYTLYGHSVIDMFYKMFQLSLKEVILFFDGVFALRLWIHDIYQASAKEKYNWKAIFFFKRISSMKGSDLFSDILYHSSMKQHGDILIDIV
jgi:hypothetical protein